MITCLWPLTRRRGVAQCLGHHCLFYGEKAGQEILGLLGGGMRHPPQAPRRPLRLACLARCLASEAICCTRQLARSLPRGHPAAGIFCARRWLFGFLTGPLCPHFLDHGHNILFGFNAKLLSNALEHFLALLQGSDRDICGTTPLLVGDCLFQASRELPHG